MKNLFLILLLLASVSSEAKVRSVWLKSDNVINIYDFEKMENDDFLASWYGSDLFVIANYDKTATPEMFHKVLYHWTYNGQRGWSGETTKFTRDFDWNWPQACRFGMYVHDISQLSKEGRAQDPTMPQGYGSNCYDPIKMMNILHTGTCAYFSAYAAGIWEGMGFNARRWNIGGGHHSVAEVYYDGGWHHYDLNQAGWIMDPTGDHVMSLAEWAANENYIYTTALAGYQAPFASSPIPKYFEDHDIDAENQSGWPQKLAQEWPGSTKDAGNFAFLDDYVHFHDMSYTLRQGEYIKLNWYPENNDWPGEGLYTSDNGMTPDASTYEYWQGDGQMVYEPQLSNQYNDYYDGLYEDHNIEITTDGITATGSGAYAVWAVHSAYQIASSAVEITSSGTVTKEISKDIGETWTAFTGTDVGNVGELYDYLLKVSIPQGTTLNSLKITTNIICNPGALPRISTVNPDNTAAWDDYLQTVRLYTYHQDETLTKNAAAGMDNPTSVQAPDCGTVTALSGYYNYNVPNPIGTGNKYITALKMGGGSFPTSEAALSDDFTQVPDQWVYDYNDMASAVLSKTRFPISGGKTSASMAITLKENTSDHESSAGDGKIRMHYDVNHSSYSGSEPLVVTYNVTEVNSKTSSVSKPPSSDLGNTHTLVCTTGSIISGSNGDYWELQYDLTGKVGAKGIMNNWVKIENPGGKPFAARATTPGETPTPSCEYPSGNPVQSGLRGGSGTNIDTYCPELSEEVIRNLRQIHHCNWDPTWNKYRVATLGNSITVQNSHWEPLNGSVSGISNAAAINAFKDSTFADNSWCSSSNSKGTDHGNQSGQTIKWVSNQVPTVLMNDKPMMASIMIGTNNVRNGTDSWDGRSCTENLDCWPDTVEFAEIVDQLTGVGVIPIVTTIPPIDDSDGGWGKSYASDDRLVPYNDKLRAFAADRKLPLIDLHQWALDHGPIGSLLSDWAHPNSCSDGNASFSDNCLDGGSSGGLQNARNYMLTMVINDIVRFVIEGQGYESWVEDVNITADDLSITNHPNPFNPSTTIRYSIPEKNDFGVLNMTVYNMKGSIVKTLKDSRINSRNGEVKWNGTDADGSMVPSGLYVCRVTYKGMVLNRKMILMK